MLPPDATAQGRCTDGVARSPIASRGRWHLWLAVVLALSTVVPAFAQGQLRWYEAYRDGVAAANRGDRERAVALLEQARRDGPAPGRRVFTYGGQYIAFLPDYYLGVAHLSSDDFSAALAAFTEVEKQGLVRPGDPEYAAFTRQTRSATAGAAFDDARRLLAGGDFQQAEVRLEAARAGGFATAKVEGLADEIASQRRAASASAASAGAAPAATTAAPPIAAPPSVTQTLPTPAANVPVDSGLGTTKSPYIPTGPVGKRPDDVGPPVDPSTTISAAGRRGLIAYFSGDYRGAVALLARAASAREAAFLACAKASLVLAGGADVALLQEARTDFRDVGPGLAPADRRFISPRVLRELETSQ